MPKAQAFDPVLQYLRSKVPQLGMFSTLDELIRAAPQQQMSAEQWQQYLQPGRTLTREGINFPLKKEELQYSGLPTFLSQPNVAGGLHDPIPKETLLDSLQGKRPLFNIHRNVEGDPRPAFDAMPEVQTVLSASDPKAAWLARPTPGIGKAQYAEHAHEAGVPGSYEESITTSPDFGSFPSHFSPQDLSWSRTTRHPVADDPQSRLMRLIEEIQSDRHEAAAEKIPGPGGAELDNLLSQVRGNPNISDNDPIWEKIADLRKSYGNESRRGYRTPEEEALIQTGPQNTINYAVTASKPPDTPFKDPADYAMLELKKQLLNSVNQGDSYLGLTRGKDQVQRYEQGMGGGKGEGMSYIYDQVYPSALRKLARQYGTDVSDVPVNIKSREDNRPQTFVDLDAENPQDFMSSIYYDSDMDNDQVATAVTRLHDEILRALSNTPQIQRSLKSFSDISNKIAAGRHEEYPDLIDHYEDSLNQIYPHYQALSPEAKSTQKTFPAMSITPEVADRVRKAGVPLWALAGATTAGGAAALGSNDANANPVEDQSMLNANSYGDGGEVTQRLSKLAKALSDGIRENIDKTPPKVASKTPAALASSLRAGFVDPAEFRHLSNTADPELTKLVYGYQGNVDRSMFQGTPVSTDSKAPLIAKLDMLGDTIPPTLQRATPIVPKPAGPVDPNAPLNSPLMQQTLRGYAGGGSIDHCRMAMERLGYASGGSTDDSSLSKVGELAGRAGVSSMAGARSRIATGIVKQLYGLDKDGNLVFGGRAWTKDQGGTPPGILDEFAAIPSNIAPLAGAAVKYLMPGHPGAGAGLSTSAPQWSQDAAARLEALNRKVASTTGIGEAQTLPEHIEDAAAMLATPMPATKVAKEAPMLQRALEYLTPVRPPISRYGTDSAVLGGSSAAIEALIKRLASRSPTPDNNGAPGDPGFETAAMQQTNGTGEDERPIHNSHQMSTLYDANGRPYGSGVDPATFAGGGKILGDLDKLVMSRRDMLKNLAAGIGIAAIPAAMKELKTDAPKAAEQAAGKGATKMSTEPMGKRYIPVATAADEADPTTSLLKNELSGYRGAKVLEMNPLDSAGRYRALVEMPQSELDRHAQEIGTTYGHPHHPDFEDVWAIHPDEVSNPHPVHQALQTIKDEAFGPSDEPNWAYLDRYLPKIPGHERVLPHYQAMKDAFFDESPTNGSDDDLSNKVNRFHQALDDLSAEHGVPIARDPNAE